MTKTRTLKTTASYCQDCVIRTRPKMFTGYDWTEKFPCDLCGRTMPLAMVQIDKPVTRARIRRYQQIHEASEYTQGTVGACRSMMALRLDQAAAHRRAGRINRAYETLADAGHWRRPLP